MVDIDLRNIPDEYGIHRTLTSQGEWQWVHFLQEKYFPDMIHAFNCQSKMPRFHGSIPDFYVPSEKLIGYFHGCYFHLHRIGQFQNPCPLINPNINFHTTNHEADNFKTLLSREETLFNGILKDYSQKVKGVCVLYECQWAKMKANVSHPAHDFFHNQNVGSVEFLRWRRPEQRLSARQCIRGGICESYTCQAEADDKYYLEYLDVGSMYPYLAIQSDFMYGTFKILTESNIDDKIHYCPKKQKFYYQDSKSIKPIEINGIMQVTIGIKAEDDHLLQGIPFLPIKHKGKTIRGTCFRCIVQQRKKLCSHTFEERAFTESYYIPEIAYALSLGYTLVKIWECHYYTQQKAFLAPFFKYLMSQKIRHEKIPTHYQQNKQQYCDSINKKMSFGDTFTKITVSDLQENEAERMYAKLFSNLTIGKFQQVTSKTHNDIIRSNRDMIKLFCNPKLKVKSVNIIDQNTLQVGCENIESYQPVNRKTNCIVGGLVSCLGRMMMDKYMRSFVNQGCKINYVDTDGAIVSVPKNNDNLDLHIDGVIPGYFKKEIDHPWIILKYFSMGPKNYSLELYNVNTQERKTVLKIRGLNLKSHERNLNENLIPQFVNELRQGQHSMLKIPQTQIRVDKKEVKVRTHQLFKKYSNQTLEVKRFLKLDYSFKHLFHYGITDYNKQNF